MKRGDLRIEKSDGKGVVFGGGGTGTASSSAVLWGEDGVGKPFVGCHPPSLFLPFFFFRCFFH